MKKFTKVLPALVLGSLVAGLSSCGKTKARWMPVNDFSGDPTEVELSFAEDGGSYIDYTQLSYDERAEALSLLEKYAVENSLTGLTLYSDGGYIKYSDRVNIPTDLNDETVGTTSQHNYIKGYGYGILSEGDLKRGDGKIKGLTGKYADYWSTYEAQDPLTLNYMNSKEATVGDITGYVFGSYFDTKMNAAKDGYEYYPFLGTEKNLVDGLYRPIPLDANGDEMSDATATSKSTKYRIYVKVGDALQYSTLSNVDSIKPYNNRNVELEDYVTPLKALYTQANGLVRGSENITGSSAIKGVDAYYYSSSKGVDEEAWKKVGIKTGTNADGSYIDFELNQPCNPFFAMYYLNSSMSAPIPQEFLDLIGGYAGANEVGAKIWGSFNKNLSLTPVDTTLSTGVYNVESWSRDSEVVFKRNENIGSSIVGEGRCNIPGIHIDILKKATSDPEAGWQEYINKGRYDACGIPQSKLDQYVKTSDGGRTFLVPGSDTTKLNINTCTPEEWEYLFGEEGTITQTPKSSYWDCEPALANEDFVLGLSWAINRKELAETNGRTPSVEYFGDVYLSNPETGLSYNDTDYHKNVMKEIYGDDWETNFGYNIDSAVAYFKKAADKLLEDGAYVAGDTISIDICWQSKSSMDVYGEALEKYFESAFNNNLVSEGKLTLDIVNSYVNNWTDVYYNMMMIGQYDMSIGGVSGNAFDPLNFIEVLKSDNSSGFTLNWGPNTNSVDNLITYKGQQFTFDALWQVFDTGALVNTDGSVRPYFDAEYVGNVANTTLDENGKEVADGRTVTIKVAQSSIEGVVEAWVDDVVICEYMGSYKEQSIMEYAVCDEDGNPIIDDNGCMVFKLPQELVEAYQGTIGFDVYYAYTLGADNINGFEADYGAAVAAYMAALEAGDEAALMEAALAMNEAIDAYVTTGYKSFYGEHPYFFSGK